ncbi:hypothetical protein BGY98DRAFT_943234 [Russula aff. rugulosa BPL654]|nr:hypothetical protein BGY98DRAFT_943234 [Russula aff. rugulosa BPL654]
MTTTTVALNCPICHLGCEACINAHARQCYAYEDYEVTCPTCRAPFTTTMPDKSTIPKKYHSLVSPPLRRVFLDGLEDNSHAVIENLNAEIAALKLRLNEHTTSLANGKPRADAASTSYRQITWEGISKLFKFL